LIVVKNPVALHVSFPERPRAGGNAYPASLMGVIAFVRQSFLDAQHYAITKQPDDPALEAMQPAVERKLPVAFEATEVRQIVRALKIAKENEARPDRNWCARSSRGDGRPQGAERAGDLQLELPA